MSSLEASQTPAYAEIAKKSALCDTNATSGDALDQYFEGSRRDRRMGQPRSEEAEAPAIEFLALCWTNGKLIPRTYPVLAAKLSAPLS